VDICFEQKFPRLISLGELRADPALTKALDNLDGQRGAMVLRPEAGKGFGHVICPMALRKREREAAKNAVPMTARASTCGQITAKPAPR